MQYTKKMRLTRKKLAQLYNINESTLGNYLRPHLKKLDKMASKIILSNGKINKLQRYNKAQLIYIVKKVMQDTPEGYKLVEGRLIAENE